MFLKFYFGKQIVLWEKKVRCKLKNYNNILMIIILINIRILIFLIIKEEECNHHH